ncbi:TlpA family protein disulfide reductase [Sphingobacterium siyangense]|uniref:Thiol-disulfide isomerase/thioredoxin n=1 Tax=Sphingobacterium siyangense TaxID=459529 RepID=A0A562MKF0_9SPHI|nr:TlpA disulfide reductase family protein [Sphingobacterium siyangense]TWI20346.1 thiol-disulfide isomerase/thioredoxin [Sphingobacterium siyangense]
MNKLLHKRKAIPYTCHGLALETCSGFMNITQKYILLAFLLMYVAVFQQVHAQVTPAKAANSFKPTPLSIGDQIPDELWDIPLQVVNHPEGKKTITLADYKGKLIILDFWATYCSPCIKNFPKLHTLQNEFGDRLKVLAVTKEDTDKITRFFKTGAGKEHTNVHSVINDSVLSKYFPHKTVPHIVWVAPNGKVLNTSQAEDITKANIQAVLDNRKTQILSKVDIDRNRPLFLSEHFTDNLKIKSYSIFAKGYYPGLPSGNNFKKTKEGKIYGRQMTNATIMSIYNPILYELFSKKGEQFNSNRIITEVTEPALLHLIKKDEKSDKSNFYNYELIIPEEKADSLYYYMLADLNRYSEYTGTIEKRMVDCLVLVRTSKQDKLKSKGGQQKNTFPASPSILINQKIEAMLNLISDENFITLPIVDETGYNDNVDIEVSDIKNLANFKKELNRYDLDLIPAKRSLNMFVIKDK